MDDALDEADETYQMVNEAFTLQDQEILNDLFAKDDHDANYKPQIKDSIVIDSQNGNDYQPTQLDAEIERLGGVVKDDDSMPAVVSVKSSGLKRPYDALDTGNNLDPNEALPDQRGKSIEKSDFNKNDDKKESYLRRGRRNIFHIKAKIVRDYFANQLNTDEYIQWNKLTQSDFVNWPDNLPIKSPFKYSKDELVILLSQLQKIRFTQAFIQKYKATTAYPKTSLSHSYKKTAAYNRKSVHDHFKKLLELNNIHTYRMQWCKLKKDDFINWPVNLLIKSPSQYSLLEMGILLSNLESIRFSEKYRQHLKTIENYAERYTGVDNFEKKRKIVVEYFKSQLKENHINHQRIGWNNLKKEDFINWPEHLPIKSTNLYRSPELTQLLSHLDKIRFSDQYLQDRRKNVGARREQNATPPKKRISASKMKQVSSHFLNQLLFDSSPSSKPNRILWSKLKKDDFINWPDHLPIKAPSTFNLKEFRTLLSHLDKIRFTEKYLEQYKTLNLV